MNILHDFICEQCGNKFQSPQVRSRFCSNKCKSKWRRDNGLDSFERICQHCGKTFLANKYSKTIYCSRSCSSSANTDIRVSKVLTHGQSKTRLYRIWKLMKQRCFNEANKDYKHYGERGIIVCDEWRDSFEIFRDWALANGYSDNLSIDRIDNDNGYFPDNCRWATDETQSRNQSTRKTNTSGVNGVHWNKSDNAWVASIKAHNKYIFLGNYKTLEAAVEARKRGEVKYWGEDA